MVDRHLDPQPRSLKRGKQKNDRLAEQPLDGFGDHKINRMMLDVEKPGPCEAVNRGRELDIRAYGEQQTPFLRGEAAEAEPACNSAELCRHSDELLNKNHKL